MQSVIAPTIGIAGTKNAQDRAHKGEATVHTLLQTAAQAILAADQTIAS